MRSQETDLTENCLDRRVLVRDDQQRGTRRAAVVLAYGPDGGAIVEALKWVIAEARRLDANEVAVLVPTLEQIEHVAPHLGLDAAKLRRERKAQVNGLRIRFINERDWPAAYQSPVLALWLDDQQMRKLDGMRLPAVCAVTWNSETDLQVWVRAWSPEHLRDPSSGDEDVVVPSVVRAALDDLLARVNRATGVTHPSDRAAAIQMLAILNRAGEGLDPVAIDAYLRRGGMSASGSAAVGEMAARTLAGTRLRAGASAWRQDVLERWRSNATS